MPYWSLQELLPNISPIGTFVLVIRESVGDVQ